MADNLPAYSAASQFGSIAILRNPILKNELIKCLRRFPFNRRYWLLLLLILALPAFNLGWFSYVWKNMMMAHQSMMSSGPTLKEQILGPDGGLAETGYFFNSMNENQYPLGGLDYYRENQPSFKWYDTEWVANGRVALFLALVFLILLWTNMQWRSNAKARLQELLLTRQTPGEILAGYSALPLIVVCSFFSSLAIVEIVRFTVFVLYAPSDSFIWAIGMKDFSAGPEAYAYPDLLRRLALLLGLLGWLIATLGATVYYSLRFPKIPHIVTVFFISVGLLVIAGWATMFLYDPHPLKLIPLNTWFFWHHYLDVHPLPLLLFWPIAFWQWHRLWRAFPKLLTKESTR